MDVERLIISKCIREDAVKTVIGRLEPHHFASMAVGTEPATADVWEWLTAHVRRYRSAPSVEIFKMRWPGFVFHDSTDPLDAVIGEFIRIVKRRKLIEKVRELSHIADNPSMVGDAEVHLLEAARDMARLVPTNEVHRYSESLNRLELYRKRMETGLTPGISLMLPELDDLTAGAQEHEMVVIEGFLGVGKSSWGIGIAAKNYFEYDQTALFLSLEMEGEKLCNRWDAYAADVSYHALKRLEMGIGDLERWEKIGEKAADSSAEKDIIVIDDLYRPSVEKIYSEIERWDPDFSIVDTMDEVTAPSHYRSSYERQGYAARELKGICRATKKPMFAVAQAGRDAEEEGAKIGNIANSIDIARKADIIIGLHATDEMQKMKQMRLEALKIRDDGGKGTKIQYFWDVDRMDYRKWRPEDAMPARQAVPA